MIAFNGENGLSERDPSELDLEHSKQDIALVRSLARNGLLSTEQIAALSARLVRIAETGQEERMRLAADKTLSVFQVACMKLLLDSSKGSGADSTNVTNQQINIYLPDNRRELTNGNGNGKH